MNEPVLVFTTTNDESIARKIAVTLLQRRLCACTQIISTVRSFYWWKGKIEEDNEFLLILKSDKSIFNKLSEVIREIHNYSVPEIVAIPVSNMGLEYRKWLYENLSIKEKDENS